MEILNIISSSELMTHFGSLVKTEHKITEQILECIVEIDRRKIYLQKAYPSLFEFLVKEYGYSPSAAMRRIESARLLKEIPEVSEKIKSGSINLSQLAKVQQTLRAVQKQEGLKVSTLQKTEILKKIENTTQAKTELILAQEFNLPTVHFDKEKIHQDEFVTLTITFSKEQMGLLVKAQALVSHSVPDQKWSEVISYLAEKEVKSRTAKDKASPAKLITDSAAIKNKAGFVSSVKYNTVKHNTDSSINIKNKLVSKNLNSKYVSLKSRKALLDPVTACCQFKDLKSGKVCSSRQFLQIDHIHPRWAGGENEASNLQVLCGSHNRYRYQLQSGSTPSHAVGILKSSVVPSPAKDKLQLGLQI